MDAVATPAPLHEPISVFHFGDKQGFDHGDLEGTFIEDESIFDSDFYRMASLAGKSTDDGLLETCMTINSVVQNRDSLLAYQSINDHLDGVEGSVNDLLEGDDELEDAVNELSENEETHLDDEQGWFPYGNRTIFFLDLLDNLPRLRLSDDHMKAVLWVMKECGTPDVPSFYALRKLQGNLQQKFLEPKRHVSSQGKEFFGTDPADLVRLDWANPLVRNHLHVYPEVTDVVSELWQAGKYLSEIPENQLTPMWADWMGANHRHFFVNEIAQLRNDEFIIPLRWIVARKEEHVEVIYLQKVRAGEYEVRDPEKRYIPCSQLSRNLLDLRFEYPGLVVHTSAALTSLGISNATEPHPVRTIAKGRPAFCVRIVAWTDDVSGNRSKQYNAHMNLYFASANIPFRIRAQESFVHFSSTSPDVSALEQLNAFLKNLRGQWHEAFDCQLGQEIIFQVHPHLFSGDNPMQAELCSNMGSMSRHWCRSDLSGGTKQERETNEGYHGLYQAGTLRQPEETITVIKNQLQTATNGVQAALDRLQRETGIKDSVASYWCSRLIKFVTTRQYDCIDSEATRDPRLKQKNSQKDQKRIKDAIKKDIRDEAMQWLFRQPPERYANLPESEKLTLRAGDHYNTLLDLPGIDIHRDTPVEILHTILLGIDKYVWYETSNKWNQQKDQEFVATLSNLATDGLSVHSFRPQYIVQYKNSLIGRDFKTLQQVAIFAMYARLENATQKEKELFQVWRATGELGALLWIPEITHMEEYLADIDTAVKNVLDSWGAFDPARIQYKYKLHCLTHLADNISRFGPPVLYATETFEAWNGVFRYCSILSNHQAPSRDIAKSLAAMERVKHFVCGGWWTDSNTGAYVSAGENIKGILKGNESVGRRLGISLKGNSNPGSVKLVASSSQIQQTLDDFICGLSCEVYTDKSHNDICKRGSWVFYTSDQPTSPIPHPGRIYKIIAPKVSTESSKGTSGLILMQRFRVLDTRHDPLGMPVLHKTGFLDIVSSKAALFIFNAQQLLATPTRSGQPQFEDSHLDDSYVLNLHALHNSHLIRRILPRALTRPIGLYDDATRLNKHNEWASGLRVTGPAKRKATQLKSAATKQKNKDAVTARAPEGSATTS
ncbi:hypothetical protein Agabi119p4_3871 [Agaricus bisporus var. burnettii]|uniref:Uncharacterized protein n=1 Tax=Agaricus bisporus var. burnettii TaxID=192524 RepID=A0A8H7F5N5_AGABI|nr:hypothetical protein Agabi119p4_3871 [Agaricus bisporus var. burnettii]